MLITEHRPTIEASLAVNGSEVTATPGQVGRELDIQATLLVTAVVDKAVPADQAVLRIIVLIAANVLLFLVADHLVTLYRKQHEKARKVVSDFRPVPVTIRKPVAEEPEVNS